MFVRESVTIGSKKLTIETGRLAKQAHGAVLVTYGDSVVLVTAVSTSERPGLDFFPLTCEYQEKTYAAGKIPGGFFKREGRLRDYETLTSRVIDRPLRPLFPEGYKKDTQVIATVMSTDKENPTDVLALSGASAALHISDIPWDGPIAGMRVARVDGEFVVFPTFQQIEDSDIDLIVAISKEAIVMVEGGADEASEDDIIDALMFAHEEGQKIIELIERIRGAVGKEKRAFEAPKLDEKIARRIAELADADLETASKIKQKKERYDAYDAIKTKVVDAIKKEFGEDTFEANAKLIKGEIGERKYHVVRGMVLDTKERIDGRDFATIRPIACEVGLLPRTHGSAMFQRGETQAIVTTTLGTSSDEQKIDGLTGEVWKQFLLHYNFPPYSTGETKPLRGPGRREIGHGALAERALRRMIPDHTQFPYTIRVVSEILESNGSSSMASVCGGTLAMMDCGVPLRRPVAGIAMGLIKEDERLAILSDILGDEDHLGDMDFKVCGTEHGITAIQMDIKIQGLTRGILEDALSQARDGRLHILDKMLSTLPTVRDEINRWAPRITSIKVKPDQIRVIIGPGGKTIKGIQDQTGADVNIDDDGTVAIASHDSEAVKKAIEIIEGLTSEPEVGKTYKGTIKRIVDFGAFVEILPNNEALLHVSEIAHERVEKVSDVLTEGEQIEVKVLSVERDGKVRLSRRELLPVPEGMEARPRGRRSDRDDGDRPRRDGDRPRRDGGRDRDRDGDRPRRRRDRRDDERPRDREERPRDREERPRDREERPRDREERPRDREERPRDREERPRDREERPRDREERPRDREERPRDRDERPRDREERPRDREERPRDREERPRDQEERPRDRDERDGERRRRRRERDDERPRDDKPQERRYGRDDDKPQERRYGRDSD